QSVGVLEVTDKSPSLSAMRASTFRALLGAFLLLFVGATACAPTSAPANPALWRISDADSDIYLFGTVHILPPNLKWRSRRMAEAFAGPETIIFETAIDASGAADIAALISRYGYNPPGSTLSSQLSADDRARLIRASAGYHIDPLQLERTRPWLAAVQLS